VTKRHDVPRWLHDLDLALEGASRETNAPVGDLHWLLLRCRDTMRMDDDLQPSSLQHLVQSLAETLRGYPTAVPDPVLEAAMGVPGDALPFALLRTEAFALGLPEAPRWECVMIGASLDLSATEQTTLSREDLVPADAFTERFAQLFSLGFPWINLSAVGVLRGALLVTVEVPAYTRHDVWAPSINVSGPSSFVRRRVGWRIDELILIRDSP
jgi:hypothetical protein